MNRLGWCFIGAGSIANRVAKDLPLADGSYAAAVWSRKFENAQTFAETYGAHPYKTAGEAMRDPAVKAVYVATPHPFHRDATLEALRLGKPVLCEKPLAMNLPEAQEMVNTAREKGIYLLDGLWTRHNPVIKQALAWVKEGRIGKVRSLQASFSFYNAFNPASRLHAPELGGGAVLDVGVYTIAMARFLFEREPVEVSATANFSPLGVDTLCAMRFTYGDGTIARLFCGISASEPQDACIAGEAGHIIIPKFWAPRSARLHTSDAVETYAPGFSGEGFQFEFNAAAADILAGKKENDLVTHQMSLDILGLIDNVMKLSGSKESARI
ncbi:MAG: Gfo/Idh/MocA family oxidoreductase [Treponema sp.]|jgi:predicted dehydrogenase|nr:Gfo/Idh/MocA family oxidoreductase [Treponema sp.]